MYTSGVGKMHSFSMRDELVKCSRDGSTETGGSVSTFLHKHDLLVQNCVSLIDGFALVACRILLGHGCSFLFHIFKAFVQKLLSCCLSNLRT